MGRVRRILNRLLPESVNPTPVAKRLKQDHLTYLSDEKLQRLQQAMSRTRDLPGDVVEFGVALGGSAVLLARQMPQGKRFFGLDVFAMIPPPTSEKDGTKSKERYEVIRSGQSPGIGGDQYYGYRDDLFAQVSNTMKRYGVPADGNRVRLVKGLFEETWPTLDIGQVSLAHVDCDWYDPVRFSLTSLAEKLPEGGVIVLDDYHTHSGCRTAVDEFLASRTDYQFEKGQNPFLVKTAG